MRERGFTYIGLLVGVVILGLALSGIGTLWRTQAQREREQELLFIGRQFRAAINSYVMSGPHQYPQTLDDLLEDKRFPVTKHHLRRLYADPMTGAPDWTLIRADMVGITGVASSSAAEPIKKQGFLPEEVGFNDATCYCDWQFVFTPRNFLRKRAVVNPAPSP